LTLKLTPNRKGLVVEALRAGQPAVLLGRVGSGCSAAKTGVATSLRAGTRRPPGD
jgi:hypothetical protein